MKDPNNDHVDELLNELEMIKDELDGNELEQEILRDKAELLEERIQDIENELDDLEVDY